MLITNTQAWNLMKSILPQQNDEYTPIDIFRIKIAGRDWGKGGAEIRKVAITTSVLEDSSMRNHHTISL
jgi:hypothetical protein